MVPPGAGTAFEGYYPATAPGVVHCAKTIGGPSECGAAVTAWLMDWDLGRLDVVCRDCWALVAAPYRLQRVEQEVARW